MITEDFATEQLLLAFDRGYGVWLLNEEGIIDYANQRIEQILELEEGACIGRNYVEFLPISGAFKQKLSKRLAWQGKMYLQSAQAHSVLVEALFVPGENLKTIVAFREVPVGGGHVITGVYDDDREGKNIEHTAEAVYILDAQTGRVINANQSACNNLGYTLFELQKLHISDIDIAFNFDLSENWNRFVHEVQMAAPDPLEKTSKHKSKDGSIFIVKLSAVYEEFQSKTYLLLSCENVGNRMMEEKTTGEEVNRFKGIIENLDNSVILVDDLGRMIYASPSFCKKTEYTLKEIENHFFYDMIFAGEVSFFKKIFDEVLITKNKSFKINFRLLHKDNTPHWVEVRLRNLLQDNSVKAIIIDLLDTNEQFLAEETIMRTLDNEKKLNEQLVYREEKLRQTLEMVRKAENQVRSINDTLEQAQDFAKMGTWSLDFNTQQMKWSRQVFKSFGLNPEITQASPQEFLSMLHEHDRSTLDAEFAKIEAGETTFFELELRFLNTLSQQYRWTLTKAQLMLDEVGQPTGFMGINLDIHDRKLAEQKIKESEFRLETINNSLPGIVIYQITFNNSAEQQYFFSYCSESVKKVLNISLESLKKDPSTFYKNIHPDDYKDFRQKEKEAYENQQIFEYETRFLKEGNPQDVIWLYLRSTPGKLTNGQNTHSGVCIDITERRTFEDKLKNANQELQKTNTELDRFVYSASHDLRAPIASALGLISLSLLSEDIKEVKYYIGLQEKTIKKLDNFIEEILIYSRNARLAISVEEIEINGLLKDIFEQYNAFSNLPEIRKSIFINQSVPLWSDKGRVLMIFTQLISNSIQYAQQRDGQSPSIQINGEINAREFSVEISDNGIGIAQEHLDKIFDMFYKATNTTVGAGLGLYIVREAVQKLDGTIHIESGLGKGTKVFLKLPNLYNQT